MEINNKTRNMFDIHKKQISEEKVERDMKISDISGSCRVTLSTTNPYIACEDEPRLEKEDCTTVETHTEKGFTLHYYVPHINKTNYHFMLTDSKKNNSTTITRKSAISDKGSLNRDRRGFQEEDEE